MDKLNLTKEQVAQIYKYTKDEDPDCYKNKLQQDWLTMHAELARLHTAIDGAMEEIGQYTKSFGVEGYDSAKAHRNALDILRKHLGEKK
jgi:hypothetical protein